MTALLILALLTAPITPEAGTTSDYYRHSPGCRNATASRTHAPSYIRVFLTRYHRVDRVPTALYVARVMASGASPSYKPVPVLRAMSVAIRQYAWWESLRGHRTGWGQCFDIRSGGWGQYYRPDAKVTPKIRRAVSSMAGVRIYRHNRPDRTGWRAGSGRDGWHLFDDTMTRLARRGYDAFDLLYHQLDRARIVR